jgi:DNA-binding CsgD family transcriptional regulator
MEGSGVSRSGVVLASPPIVGREEELRAISDFLELMLSGPCALVLEGSAGIGKTTLWLAGVAEARELDRTVLLTRAAESEARMSYAAIGDLLAGVPEAVFDGLPPPLRGALDRALLRSDAGGQPDPRAVSLAATLVLRTLAATRPVLVAIDDIQWLDRPSARVLSFVLRRLTDEPIGVLESLRLGSGAPADPVETDRALRHTAHRSVGPLTVGALGRIIRERTNTTPSRPFVVRLHDVTQGNPLFALEIARTAVSDASAGPGGPWPVPQDVQRVLSGRLAQVPAAANPALLAIAATSQPTWDLVLQVAGSDEAPLAGLARAQEAHIIERVDGRVRFTHPLLASTVYLQAGERDRRQIHRRLASLLDDPEEQARHLALATDQPDAAVAVALDQAAQHARTRGAPDAAAELADIASTLTPPADETDLRRRRLASAEYHFDAGDAQRAHQMLRDTIASSPPGLERARMLYRLASMSWMNLIDGVRAHSIEALAEGGDDPELRAGIHIALTWVAIYLGDLDEAARQAGEGERWASRGMDPGVRSDALATLEIVGFLQGRPDPTLMARAIELQDESMAQASWTEGSVYTTPRSMHALELMWAGRLDEARAILEREVAVYEEHAMYALRQEVLCYLAELECRAGRWSMATAYAAESMEIIEESGQSQTQRQVVLFNQAWPAALLGEVDEARRMATTGIELAEANDDRFNGAWNHAVLGFLELSLSDSEAARSNLEPAVAWLAELDSVEPGVIPCVPDLVEAYVALGRLDDADRLLRRLEAQALDRDRPWASGAAARGRAQFAAATGDLDGAARFAERSIEDLERAGQPFETARSWLVLGQIDRRSKRRRVARERLLRARDAFAELGARLWVRRAEEEIARIGGRSPTRGELTPTERRIAELVAGGKTNKEVAAGLVVTERTVESALTQIYRKLDVRSRTELARRLDAG